MDVQDLETNAEYRIKFASINKRGGYDNDAHEEYQSIFPGQVGELADGWEYEAQGRVETRFEHSRSVWRLNKPGA